MKRVAPIIAAVAAGGVITAAAFLRGRRMSPFVIPGDEVPEDRRPMSIGEQGAHKANLPTVIEAVKIVIGKDPGPFRPQAFAGVAHGETSYGRGWTGKQAAAAESNNWGAVSCNPANEGPETCIPGLTDHTSGGQAYTTGFKRYPSPLAGATDAARHVFKLRPITASVFESDNPTMLRFSFAMRRERYYGGFCPEATKKYGAQIASASFAKPEESEGHRACAREAIIMHARTVQRVGRYIAELMGVPAMPLGTFEDAEQWYHDQIEGKKAA